MVAHHRQSRLRDAHDAVARSREVRGNDASDADRQAPGDDTDFSRDSGTWERGLVPLRRAAAKRGASARQPRQPPRREAACDRRAEQHRPPRRQARRALEHAHDDQSSQAVADEVQPRRGDAAAEAREALGVLGESEPHRRVRISKTPVAAARHPPPHEFHRDAMHPQAVHQHHRVLAGAHRRPGKRLVFRFSFPLNGTNACRGKRKSSNEKRATFSLDRGGAAIHRHLVRRKMADIAP